MTRTLDEAYESATATSDLTVSKADDGRCAADYLTASGWSNSRLGGSLARLHTKITANDIVVILDQIARRTAPKGMSLVVPERVLAWWLDQGCKKCDGHGYTRVPGAPALSSHQCPVCKGTAKKQIPHGDDGKWVANLLDDCVSSWRQSLKGRFKHQL